MRVHGRAKVSSKNPRAFAVCDGCGFLYNRIDLQFQYQWMGPRTQSTNMLVCEDCLDVLQEQLRTIILPPDPVPIEDPRIERYTYENDPISPIGTSIGTMTQGAGLAAAFDSSVNKPYAFCCQLFTSTSGYNNSVGRYWGADNAITAHRFVATAPNDTGFFASGATGWKFQGSNLPVGFTDIVTGTTDGSIGEIIDEEFTGTTSYLYHQLVFDGNGIHSIGIAQLKIYASG